MTPAARDTHALIAKVMAKDRGRLLAALVGALNDFDLAEEALSEAVEAALIHWGRSGPPQKPQNWLLTAARRKAIDKIRRAKNFQGRKADLTLLAQADQDDASEPPPDIPDERLRLIFTCCHPALEPKTRVALTLHTLGGLSTSEIARAFLDKETTMGQRLSRAKAKIRDAGIPYDVPGPELWSERLHSVLTVVYLIFNEGYAAGDAGEELIRVSLCDEAIYLARMLNKLRPEQAETLGLLSLLLLTHARRHARISKAAGFIALEQQDRGLWDRALIDEGQAFLDQAMALHLPGPYQIKAAIAALHTEATSYDTTDWCQIVMLFDALLRMEPTPVIRLNRASALADAGGIEAAMTEIDRLRDDLEGYQPYYATRADILMRMQRHGEAIKAYDRAIELSGNQPERVFLVRRKEKAEGLLGKSGRAKLGQSPTGR